MLEVVGAEIDEVDKVLVTCFALERIGEFPDTFSIRVNVAPDIDILVDKQELCIEPIEEINRGTRHGRVQGRRLLAVCTVEPSVWFWHQFLPEKRKSVMIT